jgi:hypothetical protein
MKVYLERKLSPCPDTLKCVACNEWFMPRSIRSLLLEDNGLIYGDLCPCCAKSGAEGIQQQLRIKAASLMNQACNHPSSIELYRQGLEWRERSEEAIAVPRFYQWWWKRFEILSQETQELEKARMGASACQCGRRRSPFRITFQDEQNPSERQD